MQDLNICRICLSTGVKVYSYNSHYLKQYYEEVLAIKLQEDDKLPRQFCYECAALLYKFHKFKERCWSGQEALFNMLHKAPITQQSLSKLKTNKTLKSSLGISTVNKNVKTIRVRSKAMLDDTDVEITKEDAPVIVTSVINASSSIDNKKDNKAVKKELYQRREREDGIVKVIKMELLDETIIFSDHHNDDLPEDINDVNNCDDEIDLSNDIADKNDNIDCDNQTDVDTNQIEKNVDTEQMVKANDVETAIESKRKGKIRSKRVKQDKAYKEKQFEHSKQNLFDPKHWLVVNLNEDEVLEEFKAKGSDSKYLGAAFKCKSCFKGFSKEEMFTRHMKLRHGESRGPWSCRYCKMRFKWPCHLNKHMTEHYVRYKCLRCELVFGLKNAALTHNEYHNGVIRKCPHCGEEFRHRSTYYTHMRSHRSEHVCTLCGESFLNAIGLQLHRSNMHVEDDTTPKEEVNTYCAKCDVKFETKKAYERHLFHSAKHGGSVDTPAESTESTPAPHKLNSTLLTLKSFTRKPRKPTPCNMCDKNFSSHIAYVRHHNVAHKGAPLVPIDPSRPPGSRGERYVCEICGASLARCSVQTHLNIHTREMLFACDTCGREFNTKTILKQHQLTHTNVKPVPCPLCEKRFKQSSSMKLHYKTFHLKQPYPKRNKKVQKKNEDLLKLVADEQESDESMALDRWR